MGVGKTYSALGALIQGSMQNIIIVCPASLVLMWKKEVLKFCDDGTANLPVVHTSKTITPRTYERVRKQTPNFFIVSYNYIGVPKYCRRLQRLTGVTAIICDEAHAVKNWESSRCRGFVRLVEAVGDYAYVWMLTGTPATNSATDYYPYLNVLYPPKNGGKLSDERCSRYGNLKDFREYFCEEIEDLWSGFSKYTGMREDRIHIIKKWLKPVMLRRTRKQVLKNFPPVVSNHLTVEVAPKIVAMSAKIDIDIVEACLAVGDPLPSHVATTMRAIGMGKLAAAKEWLEGIGDAAVVVFTRHVEVLDELKAWCEKNEISHDSLSGADSGKAKQEKVERFQQGTTQIIIVNMSAGRLGHTLTRAALALFVELDWSPEVMEQAAGRLLRIGQIAASVQLTYLVAAGTIDEAMVRSVARKSKFMEEVLR
jgi:SNF2 family DNA or RNA helicase